MSDVNLRRVVVTGLGLITPVGNDVPSTWEALCEGRSGVQRISLFDPTQFPAQIAAEVKNFDPDTVVSKKEQKRFDRFSLFALAATQEAWRQANLEGHSYNPQRMGCVIGIGIGGLPVLEENHTELLQSGFKRVSPFLIPAMISNLAPGNIGIEFNLQGVNFTVTSACTSGTHAIGEAYRMIRYGMQDLIVTGGAEAAITPLGIAGFARMRALSTRNDDPQHASRPFDKGRDGFVMGEGSGILVLESLESALQRGAKPICEVVGYGVSCDAFHITAPPEDGRGAVDCMTQAIQSAGIRPEDVGYVNAHGTSTPINDPAESRAIKTVFGPYAKEGLLVSSTKSMTGHLLGAAGGVEAVFLALALKNQLVPPTANLEEPDEGCDLDYVPHKARPAKLEYVMSNSFGFGGTNATVLFKRFS